MRVKSIEFDDLQDPELRSMFEEFYRNRDTDQPSLPNHYKVEAHVPQAMKHLLKAIEHVKRVEGIDYELAQKISIAVSMANECPYCTGVYCSIFADHMGSEEVVREFQQAFSEDELTNRERDIVEFAVRMNDTPGSLTDEDFDRLRERYGFGDRDFVQLAFIVNIVNGYNRITNAFDCELEPVYHSSPWLDPYG